MDANRFPAGTTIIVATTNPGKTREFGRLLGEAFTVAPLPNTVDMPEEVGLTFAENARLKAEAAYHALGETRVVLADDSGLEVDHLKGRPGVHSARYAGESATDQENVGLLLREMEGAEDRNARFVCSLCLIAPQQAAGLSLRPDQGPGGAVSDPQRPGRLVFEVSAYAEGRIETEPRGEKGFGYDPVFRPAGRSQTLGETDDRLKDLVSHRGAAVRSLLALLEMEGWLKVEH